MFEQYLRADDDGGAEYGRSASLLDGMREALAHLPVAATPRSPIDEVEQAFTDAPVSPSVLLRNAMDHATLDLCHVMNVVEHPGYDTVSVPAVMANLRIALLAASHLCYVTSVSENHCRITHMGGLYHLEIESAKKYVRAFDQQKRGVLAGLHPGPTTAIRKLASYRNPCPPRKRILESLLLDYLKKQVLGPLLVKLAVDEALGQLLVDHTFNITSGAAHGYSWIDLDGVTCHFVAQFSQAVLITNVVFNDYLLALGRHPNAHGSVDHRAQTDPVIDGHLGQEPFPR